MDKNGPGTRVPGPVSLVPAVVILTELMDFVMVAKVAMVAIFPNVTGVGIEEGLITSAIRELDAGVGTLRHNGLGLNDWFQYEHRKKQSDEREDRFRVKVKAHVSYLQGSADRGTRRIRQSKGQ